MLSPLRVVVTYRVCQHWRAPIFARLNADSRIDLTVLHSTGVPNSKLVNGTKLDGFSHKALPTVRFRLRASGRSSAIVFCPTLGIELFRTKPDVVLAEGGSNFANNLIVFAYAAITRTPVVWWTLGEIPGRHYSGFGRVFRWLVGQMEKRSDALLGYSSVAMAYFERLGYDREKCFRAVNSVDTERVLAGRSAAVDQSVAVRKEIGLDGKRAVLFVGALERSKNVDRLIRAFGQVHPHFPDTHLLIVGDGPDRMRLESVAESAATANSVTFVGQVVSGVDAYFELGAVFVLPGLGGLAVSEAMAHGLPVICGVGDGCEVDLVQDGRNGRRITAASEGAVIGELTNHLREVLSNEAMRAAMGRESEAIIQTEHNVLTYVGGVIDALLFASGSKHPTLPRSGDSTHRHD